MGIFTGKNEKNVASVLNEENKLDAQYQVKTNKLAEKLREVMAKEQKTKDIVAVHFEEIKELQTELDGLNAKQIFETDPQKIKALEEERKTLRLSIQDKEGLTKMDARPFLLSELESLRPVYEEAAAENRQVQSIANQEIKDIDKQIEELKQRRLTLHNVSMGNVFAIASRNFEECKKKYQVAVQKS